ncbi:unnamed protein product [Mytilus edulis]|uniref:Uncharacterized protein n=1 Tax=Mytilus edulis TaxID=6550 RepID=A0A8S3TLW8_MYTED|nr:unnamed protein product [Mytilus edulis]
MLTADFDMPLFEQKVTKWRNTDWRIVVLLPSYNGSLSLGSSYGLVVKEVFERLPAVQQILSPPDSRYVSRIKKTPRSTKKLAAAISSRRRNKRQYLQLKDKAGSQGKTVKRLLKDRKDQKLQLNVPIGSPPSIETTEDLVSLSPRPASPYPNEQDSFEETTTVEETLNITTIEESFNMSPLSSPTSAIPLARLAAQDLTIEDCDTSDEG